MSRSQVVTKLFFTIFKFGQTPPLVQIGLLGHLGQRVQKPVARAGNIEAEIVLLTTIALVVILNQKIAIKVPVVSK